MCAAVLDEAREPGALLAALRECGVCTLRLGKVAQSRHAKAFDVARSGLDVAAVQQPPSSRADASSTLVQCTDIHTSRAEPCSPIRGGEFDTENHTGHPFCIPEGTASQACTGLHPAGSLSRYNIHREGVVFSNDEVFPLELEGSGATPWHGRASGSISSIRSTLVSTLVKHENEGVVSPETRQCGSYAADSLSRPGSSKKDEGGNERATIFHATAAGDTTTTSADWPRTPHSTPPQLDTTPMCETLEDPFEVEMRALWVDTCALGLALLEEIAVGLGVPGYFERELGPIKAHSQWHIKRYRPDLSRLTTTCEGKAVLLPTHTDPSLLSLVVHDRPVGSVGGMGLEHLLPTGVWSEVPTSGHGIATCFVGSVLDKITGGRLRGAKHRVALPPDTVTTEGRGRVVATFFFRPAPSARLRLVPAVELVGLRVKELTFKEWNHRVASRYEKRGGTESRTTHAVPSTL
jgi:isopenicillin N synthase-like dioxygenase